MDKKLQILTVAQKLFSQFGLKKVTTDEIALAGQVSKATIYKYYRNKSEIFREVVAFETDLMISSIKTEVAKETSIEGKFKAYLQTKINKIHELINLYHVTRESRGEYWPFIEEVQGYFMDQEKEIVKSILIEGENNGILMMKDVNLQAHIFVISLKSIEYPWAIEGQNVSLQEIVDLVIDTLINGLRKH